ncbi:MAG: fumarylacetoacetate hydrolase family protein [Chloroflexia bacterium]
MRYVTFQLAENDYHVGLVKGDMIIDITHWMSITYGALADVIDEQLDDSPEAEEWRARRERRSEALMELYVNSEHGRRQVEKIRMLAVRELGKEIDPEEIEIQVRGMGLMVDWPDPYAMVDLIRLNVDIAAVVLAETEADLKADELLLKLSDALLAAPIPRPSKHVLCLGRNYAEHAAESTRAFGEAAPVEKPAYPAIFTKATTAITGPYSDIPYDGNVSTQIDWEGELAIVIGKEGKNISREDAMQYVFGYTVVNDISARDIQKRHGGQFFKGKSLDGSCPMGPWIVTADEIPDSNNLQLTTRVNGLLKQNANTGTMLFDVAEIIEQMSLGMTLEPGDIIATGTPAGVGHARTPPEFLQPGDLVEVEIENIGTIRNHIAEV